jgi:ribonucleoside-diphosphate reductase beta chain
MSYKIFNSKKINHLEQPMFFGEGVNTARYDSVRFPYFDKVIDKQLEQFWRPEEVNLSKDISDWKSLTKSEQHIFVSNLQRQTLLDSIQGRGPNIALLPVVSVPELETWVENWGMNETVHSRSYTYILKNLFVEPNIIFDQIMDNKEIIECSKQISKYYDDFIEDSSYYNLLGFGKFEIKDCQTGETKKINITKKKLKIKLIRLIASINALEGIRFYVSFACSWSFAERKLMEGNAKIIKLICRDENLHLSSTQYMLNSLRDSGEYDDVWEEVVPDIYNIYTEAVNDEKNWAKYLFKHDSMIGLNEKILGNFVEWIANKRLEAIGLEPTYEYTENPIPWVNSWIAQKGEGSSVQVAPQETEISSYLIGAVKQDVKKDSFKGFELK